ncbi:MAG TPA: anti-sigma factor [Methylovirgula sp.]|nr:anti-sigma factor [Methylovirgula sp.]
MMEEIEFQAAEYVLGTLDAGERGTFESLLATNPQARNAVTAWQQRLSPLASPIADVPPPPEIWHMVARRLEDVPPTGPSAESTALLETVSALHTSRNRWRLGAYVAAAVAAGFAFFAADRLVIEHRQAETAYVAIVDRGGDLPALIIRVDLATRSVFVRPVATQVPEGRSLELWWIGENKKPKSMGLVDKDTRNMPLPSGAHIEKASFAVSVEPLGGSRSNGPTGPIVYEGQLLKY